MLSKILFTSNDKVVSTQCKSEFYWRRICISELSNWLLWQISDLSLTPVFFKHLTEEVNGSVREADFSHNEVLKNKASVLADLDLVGRLRL